MAAAALVGALALAGLGPRLGPRTAVTRVRTPILRATPADGEPAPASNLLVDVRNMTAAINPLIDAIVAYRTEASNWDAEQSAAKRAAIIDLYQQLFVPAAGFAIANLGVYLAVIGFALAGLEACGIGFVQARDWLLGMTHDAPWIASTVGRLDPKLGNRAIALLIAELAGPLVIGVSLALSSRVTEGLRGFLASRGLDARGASEKLEQLLVDMKKS
jgi:hypothetical protein